MIVKFFMGSGASRTYTDERIAALSDSAPELLNTLNELAAALNDDANFASTVTSALSTKVDSSDARLSDSRTPTAHASSHGSAGADAITVAQSQVSGLPTTLAGKAEYAAVADESAMLASSAKVGQFVYRQDTSKTYVLTASPATTIGNWEELVTAPAETGLIGAQALPSVEVGLSPFLLAGM